MNDLASASFLALGRCRGPELERVLLRGETPSLDGLVGWEYRGLNVAFWAPFSPIQKFIKGFYRDPAGTVYGYNEPVVQNGPEGPWRAKPSDADPRRFGFFRVAPVDPASRDDAYLHALLLDYGRGGNPLWDPSRRLRDYIVRVHAGSDELLLGKATLALGPGRLPTNHFVLERHRRTDWTP
ncbi:MAG: hypothetical protein D6731_03340 [Planctomycetota bacterium]|nr:MAG: hypothetical protein D6731_03340 [Planctomycetota bacterium]